MAQRVQEVGARIRDRVDKVMGLADTMFLGGCRFDLMGQYTWPDAMVF